MKSFNALLPFLFILLVVTGCLSALAILSPVIVELGFYMLVFPGFFLMIMPIVFLAVLVFTLAFWLGSRLSGGKVGAVVGILAVITALTVPGVIDREGARTALAKASKASIMPIGPVTLSGNIGLKLPINSEYANPLGCSGLCMDLLHRPLVTSVTEEMTGVNGATTAIRYVLLTDDAACTQAKANKLNLPIIDTAYTGYVAANANANIFRTRKATFESGAVCLITEPKQTSALDHIIEISQNSEGPRVVSWSLVTPPIVHYATLKISEPDGKVQFFAGNWRATSLSVPLITALGRKDGKPALGWGRTHRIVGETKLGLTSLLYIAVFGEPPVHANEPYSIQPQPKLPATQP